MDNVKKCVKKIPNKKPPPKQFTFSRVAAEKMRRNVLTRMNTIQKPKIYFGGD